MDFIEALPPRPPRSSTSQSISSSSSSPSDNDGDSEASRVNEPFDLVKSTFKDLYDYIALESSNPGLFMGSEAASLFNSTFLELNASLGSGDLSNANGTALSLLQANTTANVVSIAAAAAAAAATIASVNGTAAGPATDVQARGFLDTLSSGEGGAEDDFSDVIITTVTSIILGLMILITVIGNVFVIAAIILERNLQNVANYLVASLAVADLFVACLVMPLGAVYEICGWIMGPALCDIWTSCDVLCCTASILHLVAIATDRYWAVTQVDYIHSRTSNRVFTMIFLVWFSAVIVSLAPQFGWKDPEYMQRIQEQKCMVSQDVAYQVFATCCTFYVPLLVILVLYWKIYQTARKRIRRRRNDKPKSDNVSQSTPNPKSASTSRIPFRLARFTTQGRSTLGLVEGHSTNTVNTVEDTEFSSNEKKGIEVTSFNNSDVEGPTATTMTITTSLNQSHPQHLLPPQLNQHHPPPPLRTTSSTSSLQIAQEPPTPPVVSPIPGQRQQITTVSHFIVSSEVGDRQQSPETDANAHPMTNCTVNSSSSSSNGNNNSNNIIINSITNSNSTSNTNNNGRHQQPNLNPVSAAPVTAQCPTLPSTPTARQEPHHLIQLVNQQLSAAPSQVSTPVQHCTVISTSSANNPQTQVTKRKETLEAKRERKAAKTLAIITGAFVVCWLPFFITALLMPLCESCQISDTVFSFFLWLGYFNSTLNPVIYTIFSPEFRQAFKRILFGGHRNSYYRSGKF